MRYLNNILFANAVGKMLYAYLVKYPTPMNINYLWNFGFMSAIFLVIQIISGLFLTFFFTPHVDLAFLSVEHIMRDVNYGWLIRYIHANGASFFFFLVYIHILKGIYYGSYYFPRTLVWFTGVIIYILMMGTAFLGYVLPWGQMSYWAATVITNFVTVIPVVGKDIVYWVWGGYSINNATLNRFFSLHYLLPFVIAVLSVYHIYQLHKSGSSNELGVRTHYLNKISFYPYFIVKDFFGLFIILFVFSIFVFFFPEAFNHSDNYIKANPLVTPAHIVPEWYFLPLYGILRSILNKTYGIIIMFVALLVLFLLPFIDKSLIKNKTFKPFSRTFFWFFSFNFLFLGYLGSQTPVFPYIELGLFGAHFHLLYFFLIIPLSVIFESSFFYFSSSNKMSSFKQKMSRNFPLKSKGPKKGLITEKENTLLDLFIMVFIIVFFGYIYFVYTFYLYIKIDATEYTRIMLSIGDRRIEDGHDLAAAYYYLHRIFEIFYENGLCDPKYFHGPFTLEVTPGLFMFFLKKRFFYIVFYTIIGAIVYFVDKYFSEIMDMLKNMFK